MQRACQGSNIAALTARRCCVYVSLTCALSLSHSLSLFSVSFSLTRSVPCTGIRDLHRRPCMVQNPAPRIRFWKASGARSRLYRVRGLRAQFLPDVSRRRFVRRAIGVLFIVGWYCDSLVGWSRIPQNPAVLFPILSSIYLPPDVRQFCQSFPM